MKDYFTLYVDGITAGHFDTYNEAAAAARKHGGQFWSLDTNYKVVKYNDDKKGGILCN